MATRRRRRGYIESLPSNRFRAVVYAGVDPLTGKRRNLTETVATYDLGGRPWPSPAPAAAVASLDESWWALPLPSMAVLLFLVRWSSACRCWGSRSGAQG